MDTEKVWESCLIEIESHVSGANFKTWFKNTYIESFDDGVVRLAIQNEFGREWLQSRHHKLILKSLVDIAPDIKSIEYIIASKPKKNPLPVQNTTSFLENKTPQDSKESQSPYHTQILMTHPKEAPQNELPLHDLYINREDNLNPKYTFQNFIVGGFNELAHAAAQGILERPGSAYNPFFIYGGTGLGKTHLLQAVGNTYKTLYPGIRVFYTTFERFSVDYINAVLQNKPNQFKEKYRKYDVLIMDDIQFISNREKTQEELFHLFNEMHQQNKQIIFSSDKHPNYITGLEERLLSRFSAGMIVDVKNPEFESRLAIITRKTEEYRYFLPLEICKMVADYLEGNIREIEGFVNMLIGHITLKKQQMTLTDVKNLIRTTQKPKKSTDPKKVIDSVCDFYNLDTQSVFEKTRKQNIVHVRQVIMYILREDFHLSFPQIGELFGGKDHTTVMHACEKIRENLVKDATLVANFEEIRNMLRT